MPWNRHPEDAHQQRKSRHQQIEEQPGEGFAEEDLRAG